MSSFTNLVVNEWFKLTKKRSFFVAFLIMLLMPLGIAFVVKNFMSDMELTQIGFLQSIIDFSGGGSVFVFLCMIYAASIVSGEHQLGTIKLLLIRAHSRSKILASKFVALLLFMLVLLLYSLLVGLLVYFIFFGFGNMEGSWFEVVKASAYTLVYTIVYLSIIFMLSILTKSTGATIGITFCIIFLEGVMTMLLSRYDFAKYVLFFNTNLQVYENGTPPMEGMSLGFSVAVIAIHLIAIVGIAFYVFKKRDVA